MASERGVVAVDRAIFDHPLLQDRRTDKKSAMVWMITEAAWRPRRAYISGNMIEIKRGQLIHSLRYMAKKWGWTVKEVRGFLQRLSDDGTINLENGGKKKGTAKLVEVSIITLCNYDKYQFSTHEEACGKGTARAQQGHKDKEGNKEEGVVGVAEAENGSQPDFKKQASDLTDKIYGVFGFDLQFIPPGWMGLQYAIEAGLRGNKWNLEIVRIACVKVAAKQKPSSFKYLLPAIEREHQEAAEMLKRMESTNGVQNDQREFTLLTPINGGRRKGKGLASLAAEALRSASGD